MAWIRLGPGIRVQGWIREEVIPGSQGIQLCSDQMLRDIRRIIGRIERIGAGHRDKGVSGKHREVPNMVLGSGL